MPDVQELLRQAEMKHQQLKMEVTFRKNMAFLKQVSPDLYQRFENYTPSELRLSYDADNHLNLVNFNLNNKPVYQGDPVDFCHLQFKKYQERPNPPVSKLLKTENAINRFYQVELINELVEQFDTTINKPNVKSSCPIGMMLVIGCGLGYHIEHITQELNVKNICIFDPHPDSFYASLHVIDWESIIRHYITQGGIVKFYIGMSREAVLTDMRTLGNKVGLYNLGVTFVYKHFDSEEGKQFLSRYRKEYHLNLTGIGFLEDEQISVAHSLTNIKNEIPVFRTSDLDFALPPAVIVGNGPSLDDLEETLKDLQSKAIIFSCGSATPTLYRMGIKPHIHIEMERTSPTANWLKEGTDEDFLKDIVLMALNTVSPHTYNLFKQKVMFNKPNDLGTLMIDNELDIQFPRLGYCNPTVTNCGLSSALYLGFDEIYLAGVDLGMISEDKHHSKTSLYFALSDKTQDIVNDRYKKNTYTRKGNFRPAVLTNTDFDTSRTNMETIIRMASGAKKLNIFNLNDGAFIEGTTPLRHQKIRDLSNSQDITETVEKILEKSFQRYSSITINTEEVIQKYFRPAIKSWDQLYLKGQLRSVNEIDAELNRVFAIVKSIEERSPTSEMLLRGSINSFFTVIARACYYIEEDQELSLVYEKCRTNYHHFLDRSLALLQNNIMSIDDTAVIWEC